MTNEQETLRLVGAWLEEGRKALPDHVLDAALAQLPTKPQRRPWWPAWRVPNVPAFARYAIAAAAVVAVAIIGVNVLQAPGPGGPPSSVSPSPSPSVVASPTPWPPPVASLPALRLPGARGGPAGEYGWEGGPGDRAGMHKVTEAEVTALIFSVGPDCLTEGGGQEAVPVRVADLDGVSIEPYEPPVTFTTGADAVTRAHALAVGDRTLCVFLTWHPTTTDDELAAAEDVLDTLRAVQVGEDRIRITFTLDRGWDTG